MVIEKAFDGLMVETDRHVDLIARGQSIRGYFVGFKPREFLVIEVPISTVIDTWLTKGNGVMGSFCTDGTLIQFKSSITALLKGPAWLLIVSYPSRLAKICDLRSSYRAECSIPCNLVSVFDLHKYSGLIKNMSVDGCKCVLPSIPPRQVEKLSSEKKVLLEFDLPGSRGKKGFLGEIVHMDCDGTKIALGIKFNGTDDQETLEELNEYILKVRNILCS
jgi:hypothetical protein